MPKRLPEIEALRAQLNQARAARACGASARAEREACKAASSPRPGSTKRAPRTSAKSLACVKPKRSSRTRCSRSGATPSAKRRKARSRRRRAALAQAAWRLDQKSVATPVGGLVHETFFVEGEWVPAGRPVAALLPPGNVKARFYVPETSLSAVSVGRDIEIRCDGCPGPVVAR